MDGKKWIVVGGAAALAVAALLAGLLLARRGTDGAENGIFANDCCGTVRLESGTLALNEAQNVHYTIGRDAAGAYLLPAYYVGVVEDQGLEVDGTRPPLKLRLDRMPHPQRIVLTTGRISYVFSRKPPPPPRR
jgi:hypothetical protein